MPMGILVLLAVVNLKRFRNHPPGCRAVGQVIPKPPTMMDPSPRVIMQVQRVTRKGGISISATRTPFTRPIRDPKSTLTSIPTTTGTW